MAVKVNLQITRDGDKPDISSQFISRSYDLVFEQTLSLTTTKVEVRHHLSTIEFVYAERTDTGTDGVYLYKNLSGESYEFSSVALFFVTDIEQLSLSAETTATVRLFLGGS
jgi:hypothetical protein